MKAPASIAAIVLVSGTAGWFSVSNHPMPPPGEREPSAEGGGRKSMVPPIRMTRAPEGAETTDLAALEAALLNAMNPVPGFFNGERLAELCLHEATGDLTGHDAAFSYASAWAAHDPPGMFDWFMKQGSLSLPATEGRYEFTAHLFTPWTENNPDAALGAALTCRNSRDRSSALRSIVDTLRKTGSEQAREVTSLHLDKISFKDGGAMSPFDEHYRETWDFLNSLPPVKGRDPALAEFFECLAMHHEEDAERIWQSLSSGQRENLLANGFEGKFIGPGADSFIRLDGIADLQRRHAESTQNPRDTANWLRRYGGEWAAAQPAEAIPWTIRNLKGQARATETSRMFLTASAHQFDTALAQWRALPEGQLRVRAAVALATGAPADKRAQADAVLAALPPSDQRLAEAVTEEVQAMWKREEELREKRRNY